jgi:hypothetical protein
MNICQFWQVIDVTQAPTPEEQVELFKINLRQLSPEELTEFDRIFTERSFAAYGWDLWVVAWLCQGGMCSDDGFEYFRRWLISRGRVLYDAAMEDPDLLVDEISRVNCPEFEEFPHAIYDVYKEKTGQDFPQINIQYPKEPTGGDWLRPELKDRSGSQILNLCVVFNEMGDQEFAAIERRFPKTWEYCVQKGIITTNPPATPAPGDVPAPEEVAATVDPNLAQTDFAAYLKALNEAAKKAYKKED